MNNSLSDEKYIQNLSSLLYEMCRRFYWERGLNDKVFLDEAIFSDCLVDVIHDLHRLCEFHEIEHPSMAKIAAYSASWIIKRKPLQMVYGYDSDNPKYKYFNEKLALFILLRGTDLIDWKYPSDEEAKKNMRATINRLLYHLVYRNTNSQTLELLLYGIEFGYLAE